MRLTTYRLRRQAVVVSACVSDAPCVVRVARAVGRNVYTVVTIHVHAHAKYVGKRTQLHLASPHAWARHVVTVGVARGVGKGGIDLRPVAAQMRHHVGARARVILRIVGPRQCTEEAVAVPRNG